MEPQCPLEHQGEGGEVGLLPAPCRRRSAAVLMFVGTGASGAFSRGSEDMRTTKEGQEGEASLGAGGLRP